MAPSTSRTAALLLVLSGVLAGCTSDRAADDGPSAAPSASSAPTPSASYPRVARYVALGDSYSAGPGITAMDLAYGCARSNHNYPSLLAARLRPRTFVDVSCSGARTVDVSHPHTALGGSRIPAQIRAVTRGTDLVTMTMGGNDLDLFATLTRVCPRLAARDRTGAPCTRALARNGTDLAEAATTISARVGAALQLVRRRAPKATVVLIGYLRQVPDRGTCRALPLATGDYALGRRISGLLDRGLARAAKTAGARFVDMYDASRGHDVCSSAPWVNGSTNVDGKAIPYHPFLVGMRADARGVLDALTLG